MGEKRIGDHGAGGAAPRSSDFLFPQFAPGICALRSQGMCGGVFRYESGPSTR